MKGIPITTSPRIGADIYLHDTAKNEVIRCVVRQWDSQGILTDKGHYGQANASYWCLVADAHRPQTSITA